MVDMVTTSNLDTDIDMPDAPPLDCYQVENWINQPVSQFYHNTLRTYSNDCYQQNLVVAEGIAAANAMLARIEYFVRTGAMPVWNLNFNSYWVTRPIDLAYISYVNMDVGRMWRIMWFIKLNGQQRHFYFTSLSL